MDKYTTKRFPGINLDNVIFRYKEIEEFENWLTENLNPEIEKPRYVGNTLHLDGNIVDPNDTIIIDPDGYPFISKRSRKN